MKFTTQQLRVAVSIPMFHDHTDVLEIPCLWVLDAFTVDESTFSAVRISDVNIAGTREQLIVSLSKKMTPLRNSISLFLRRISCTPFTLNSK